MEHFQCECGYDDCTLEISDKDYEDAYKFYLNEDEKLLILNINCKHKSEEFKLIVVARNYLLVKKR